MNIRVNGQAHPWRESLNLLDLLQELDLADKRVAVELNGQIIPRSQHAQQAIAAGDQLEIVQAIGGG